MLQAPKGGQTSQVNGKFYIGGEFMPDTGLHCGKPKVDNKKAESIECALKNYKAGYKINPEKYGLTKEEWNNARGE